MNDIRFDKYHLLERISHGGMAEVFRAKTFGAAGFEREVAIKLLLPTVAMDREFITMLIDEAKIAGQLSHANIAQIFDLGMAEGRYYIVQEYVHGRDLRAIIRRCRSLKQPLSVAQACHIMMKVCEGLDYAHNKRDSNGRSLNLVHRDVSPQNILVSMDGEVKLIDFGIAKAEGRATRTLAGLVKGKFAYMSPEQIRGLPVDRRSDVFACGIVLHELLTAKPLFLRKSEFETLKRARSGEIPPPSTQNPAVPEELDELVLTTLARHVDDRHQSAKAMREALWDFIKQSGHFYSQSKQSEWMRDTFGGGDEQTQNTAVTTERDKKLKKFSDFSPGAPTGDETGRTFRDTPPSEKFDLPASPKATMAESPGARRSTTPNVPFSSPAPTSSSPFQRAPSAPGLPAPLPPSPGRPVTPGPFGIGAAPPTTPVPSAPPVAAQSSARELPPENLYDDLGEDSLGMPPLNLPMDTDINAGATIGSSFSNQRTIPFHNRASRHSMRALSERSPMLMTDEADEPSRRDAPSKQSKRINILVLVAVLLLVVAGATSLTLALLSSGGDDTTEEPAAP